MTAIAYPILTYLPPLLASNVQAATPWLTSLAYTSGVIAIVLLVLLTLSGVCQIAGISYRILEPQPAWKLHQALAGALVACIILHAGAILVDSRGTASLVQALTPLTPRNAPVTVDGLQPAALLTTLGIIAVYAATVFVLLSVFWHDTQPWLWRIANYAGCALLTFLFWYGLYLGTRLPQAIHVLWWADGGVILFGAAARLVKSRPVTP